MVLAVVGVVAAVVERVGGIGEPMEGVVGEVRGLAEGVGGPGQVMVAVIEGGGDVRAWIDGPDNVVLAVELPLDRMAEGILDGVLFVADARGEDDKRRARWGATLALLGFFVKDPFSKFYHYIPPKAVNRKRCRREVFAILWV